MTGNKIDSILRKAKETITENDKVKGLIADVKKKLETISSDSEARSTFIHQVQIFIRMVRAHISGSYKAFSPQSLMVIVFGLLYFITPVDLIPDFIPVIGFTDDVSLIYFIFKSLSDDILKFKAWEEEMKL